MLNAIRKLINLFTEKENENHIKHAPNYTYWWLFFSLENIIWFWIAFSWMYYPNDIFIWYRIALFYSNDNSTWLTVKLLQDFECEYTGFNNEIINRKMHTYIKIKFSYKFEELQKVSACRLIGIFPFKNA